ncbi:hypothetical protein ABEW50_19765 [Paenibacillus jamilae]
MNGGKRKVLFARRDHGFSLDYIDRVNSSEKYTKTKAKSKAFKIGIKYFISKKQEEDELFEDRESVRNDLFE